ncbi:putative F-box/LRR-repeat protein At3g59230 [Vicia villosa]|uniref:putative F-box/LRR-repeat protein At3g59230 n=1 Tax=Vicia villosa TaxID=3911 RepID=UPI00273BE474|nr:putative F-box/LRR-repeat protein At3g59230 [Vicia villosa]
MASASSENEGDAFNNLLDDLVCHILSFLPTKMAYRTSVLSKRWAVICTKILDFHFILPKISDPTSSREIQSVYAIFLRRENDIRKLMLESDNGCQQPDVYHWVLKALDLKVKELHLDLNHARPSFLPLKLSTSESLVVLKLGGNIQPKFSYCSKVYFPKLKTLHLLFLGIKCFRHQVEFTLFPFLSGCPLLEEFLLHDVLVNQSIKISFPLLKRLILILRKSLDIPGDKTLQINVPSSLEVFRIFDNGSTPIKYECIDFFNVDEATIYINKHPDFDSLYQLLKGISKVKSLYLGIATTRFLSMEDNLEKLSRLPTFSNLLFFEVHISENCDWNMLVSFLQNAPKLKSLVIEKNCESKKDGKSGWVVPAEIPTCLSTSLITFEFRGIQDMETELEFTRYIINESSKLENVKIFATKGLKTVRKSLRKGSRKSPALLLDIKSV